MVPSLGLFVGNLIVRVVTEGGANLTTRAKPAAAGTQNLRASGQVGVNNPFALPDPPTKRRVGDRALPTPPPQPNHACLDGDGLSILATSPIKLAPLISLLRTYPKRAIASYLASGFLNGFRIPYTGEREATDCNNLKSARALPEVLAAKIKKECEAGRVAGPFLAPPIPNLRVSPLGVVPKKAPGQFRWIHHLSYPKGSSVNDFIAPELCSVKYSSFDDAVSIVRACGRGALMAKCDVQSAFTLLPVYPSDFCLLGFKFDGQWFIDKVMPMGCSVACTAFEAFSTFLQWAARERSRSLHITHYLDDFLFVGPSGTTECANILAIFQRLSEELGIPLAEEKTVGPAPQITYLGILLDSELGLSRLPEEKLSVLRQLLLSMGNKKKCTLRDMQVLIGHLNFACKVVSPGRAFCTRLTRSTAGVSAPHHHIRITAAIREDLSVWREFLDTYNGASIWQTSLSLENSLQVHSDAAGSLGFGVIYNNCWCARRWPLEWEAAGLLRDLTFLELFPIVVAVYIWHEHFSNKKVLFWCDNLSVVRIINRQTSRSERVMRLVRMLVLTCLKFNITFSAKHIAGTNNDVADALSRFQEERFRSLAPGANQHPEAFPTELWNLGST